MLDMIHKRLLKRQIAGNKVPECVAFVLPEGCLGEDGPGRICQLIGWCGSIGVREVILYTGEGEPDSLRRLEGLKDAPARITLHTADGRVVELGRGGEVRLIISLGYGGRMEVSEAIRSVLVDVDSGLVEPEEIDESMIDSKLRFRRQPDLVIRAGGPRLSDFMIWQTAYSEFYFTDWKGLREVDFLRAIGNYQQRERRFGR